MVENTIHGAISATYSYKHRSGDNKANGLLNSATNLLVETCNNIEMDKEKSQYLSCDKQIYDNQYNLWINKKGPSNNLGHSFMLCVFDQIYNNFIDSIDKKFKDTHPSYKFHIAYLECFKLHLVQKTPKFWIKDINNPKKRPFTNDTIQNSNAGESSDIQPLKKRAITSDIHDTNKYDSILEEGEGESASSALESALELITPKRLSQNPITSTLKGRVEKDIGINTKERCSLQKKIDVLLSTVIDTKESLFRLQNEQDKLTGRIYVYNEEGIKIETKQRSVEDYLKMEQNQKQRMNDKLTKLKKQNSDSKKQIADSKKQIADAEQKIADAEQRVVVADQKIADAEQRVVVAEQKIADAEQRVVVAEQKNTYAEQQTAFAEQKNTYAEKRASVAEHKMVYAQQKIENLEQDNIVADLKTSVAKQETSVAKQETANAKQETANAKQKVVDVDAVVAGIKDELEDAQDLNQTQLNFENKLKDHIDRLKEQVRGLNGVPVA
jgi:hypothetical protein